MITRSFLPFASMTFVALGTLVTPADAREIPGFPVRLGEGETTSSPAVADIDRNGTLDIVMGVGDQLFAVDSRGRPLEGFPIKLGNLPEDANKRFFSSPALCDLDGDGRLSILSGGPDNFLYVYGPNGRPRAGFPKDVGAQLASAPLCADVNNDGTRDIVVAVPSKEILGFSRDGSALPGFPVRGVVPAESAIAAADLTPGGPLELLVGGDDGKLYLFDGRGVVDRRRAKTNFRITGGASLGDIDGDGKFDVIFGSQDFSLYAVDFENFALKKGFPVPSGYRIYGAPALGDLNSDDIVDVVFASADGRVYAVDSKGKNLPGWPVRHDGKVVGTPSIGDLDLDGHPEVVAVSEDGKIYVWDQLGRPVRGTPFSAPGKNKTSPVIVQLDGKFGPEIVMLDARGNLHAFSVRTKGKLAAARIPWPTFGHDAERVSRTRPNPSTFGNLQVLPGEPLTTSDLRVDYVFSDLDGTDEGATKIVWFKNGARVKELDDKRVVPAAMTRKGERWMARVQGADDAELFGEGEGARFFKTPIVKVLNTPPAAPRLATVGAARGDVRFADEISVQVATPSADPDNDKIRYRTIWTVDESPVRLAKSAMALPKGTARRGQRVSVMVIPIDNEEEGEPARVQWTFSNTAPTPPTVQFVKTEPTPATGAELKVVRPGADVDNDALKILVTWTLDGTVLPLLPTALSVPGALLKRGATLAASVTAFDGELSSTEVVLSTVIGNTRPGAPSIAIGPDAPTSNAPLFVRIATRAPDADGDVPTYSVTWSENGKRIEALDNRWSVPKKFLKKGQKWRATVVANDGASEGPPANADVRIGNRAPVPPVVALRPQSPTAATPIALTVSSSASDPDGDTTTLKTRWFANDIEIDRKFVKGESLAPGGFRKGQRLRAEVVASDGEATSVASGDTVVIGDLPPAAPAVRLEPKSPRTETDLSVVVVTAGTDPDNDPVTYRTHWFVNGARVELGDTVTRLPAKYFVEGDTVEVKMWSIADSRESETVATATTTVISTPPPAPVVAILPAAPLPGEPLRIHVISQAPDVDGHQVRYDVSWTRSNSKFAAGIDGVVAKTTKKGETWAVEVVAVDGADRSAPATASVVIGNQSPIAPRIELSKSRVPTTEPVTLSITRPASDSDGDAVKLAVTWTRDGKDVPALAGKMGVAPSDTKKGERYEVTVVANDGTDQSEPVRASFSVVDTPPTSPQIAFVPKVPIAGSDVEVQVTGASNDVDGDAIRYDIKWFLDGKALKAKPSQFSVAGRLLKVGKELRAQVVAVAAKAKSSPVEVRADIAPARPDAPSIVILPASPRAGETLFAKVSPASSRGAPAEVQISWLKNGSPANLNAASVPAGRTRRGEKWEAVAVATVAGKQSAAVKDTVTIQNRPPLPPVVDLSARSVTTDKAVTVRVTTPPTDPDGDKIDLQIAWFKNGKVQKALAGKDTVPAAMTRKGDQWVVKFSTSDGDLSAPVVTDAFVVRNTAPPASTVVLSPARPTSGQGVVATITPTAPDVDGDRVKHAIRFLVDGVPVAAHDGVSTQLKADAFKHGQRVTVEVIPNDGEDDGPIARAFAVSENSAPTLASVSVRPEKATSADTLTCVPSASPSDADKDPLDLVVAWEIGGKRTGASGTNVALMPGNAPPGAKVRCVAYVTDGELSSAEVTSAEVEVRSQAPGKIEVSMEPREIVTGDAVRCGALGAPIDPDGEPISVAVEAFVDGKAQGSATIAAGKLREKQTVECRARPSDSRVAGTPVTASTVVRNARPSAPTAKISHPWPRAGVDDLACDVEARAKDPEDDKLLYRIEWIRNGKPAGLPPNARAVPKAALVPADVWACRVYARDDGGEGLPSASVQAFVRKAPPEEAPQAALPPTSAVAPR